MKTSNPRVAGLCVGNSPVTGEFPAQKASNAETGSIWWRHHDTAQNLPVNNLSRKKLTLTYTLSCPASLSPIKSSVFD